MKTLEELFDYLADGWPNEVRQGALGDNYLGYEGAGPTVLLQLGDLSISIDQEGTFFDYDNVASKVTTEVLRQLQASGSSPAQVSATCRLALARKVKRDLVKKVLASDLQQKAADAL